MHSLPSTNSIIPYIYAGVGYNSCGDCRFCNSWYSSSSQKMVCCPCPKNIRCECFQIKSDIHAFVWKCPATRLVVDLTVQPGYTLGKDQRGNSGTKPNIPKVLVCWHFRTLRGYTDHDWVLALGLKPTGANFLKHWQFDTTITEKRELGGQNFMNHRAVSPWC